MCARCDVSPSDAIDSYESLSLQAAYIQAHSKAGRRLGAYVLELPEFGLKHHSRDTVRRVPAEKRPDPES